MYKIMIYINTYSGDKWFYYQENEKDYVARSLHEIKETVLTLIDTYGKDNIKIVKQVTGEDMEGSVETFIYDSTDNYEELVNRPSINGVEVIGQLSLDDLGIQPAGDYATNEKVDQVEAKVDAIDLEPYATIDYLDEVVAGIDFSASNENITGVKTFSVLPRSTVAPTLEDELTNKSYVDHGVENCASKEYVTQYVDDSIANIDSSMSEDQLPYVIFMPGNNQYGIGMNKTIKSGETFDNMQNFLNKKYEDFYVIIRYNNFNLGYGGDFAAYRCYYTDRPSLYSEGEHSERFVTAGILADNNFANNNQMSHVDEFVSLRVTINYTVSEGNIALTSISIGYIRQDAWLAKNNTSSYTPTSDYHPATKKYVDDSVSGCDTVIYGYQPTQLTSYERFESEILEQLQTQIDEKISNGKQLYELSILVESAGRVALFKPYIISSTHVTYKGTYLGRGGGDYAMDIEIKINKTNNKLEQNYTKLGYVYFAYADKDNFKSVSKKYVDDSIAAAITTVLEGEY